MKFAPKNGGSKFICTASHSASGQKKLNCVPVQVNAENDRFEVGVSLGNPPTVVPTPIRLKPAFPWEFVSGNCDDDAEDISNINDDNVKTWRFLVYNRFPATFDMTRLQAIATVVENYISTYFYPSYRIKAKIVVKELIDPANIVAAGLIPSIQQMPDIKAPESYIPIYLAQEFSPNVANGFGTSVHGGINDSVLNGIHPFLYINGLDFFHDFAPPPAGYPWAVIAAGSTATQNGVNGEVAANRAAKQGPQDFYSVFAHALAHEVIEILGNPGGLTYIINGDTLSLGSNNAIKGRENCYLRSLCSPFSFGNDNLMKFQGYLMPNFALPCYWHPYVNILSAAKTGKATAVYDILGNGRAPFTPYKGSQFVIYQKATGTGNPPPVSDMMTGNYISMPSNSRNIVFVSGGSIYDYASWGFTIDIGNGIFNVNNSKKVRSPNRSGDDEDRPIFGRRGGLESVPSVSKKQLPNVGVNGGVVIGGRRSTIFHLEDATGGGSVQVEALRDDVSALAPVPSFDPTKPQLLPFQYVNSEGFLTVRFAIVNYDPAHIDATTCQQAAQAVVTHHRLNNLPHWGVNMECQSFTVTQQSQVPKYDGTFIPFIIVAPEQYNQSTGAVGFLAGGASDVNNVPDFLAGPTVDYYFVATPTFTVPQMPLGLPFVDTSGLNFHADCQITTNKAGLGPFRAGVASFEPSNFTLPFTAKATVATPDSTACATPTGTTNGVPIANNILIFNNDPRCQTAGPTRFKHVDESGCAASIAVVRSNNVRSMYFPSNYGLPYVPEPSQYMVGVLYPDGVALMNEANVNNNLQITIGVKHYPSPEAALLLGLLLSHETSELANDCNYATYIAVGDPPTDNAILFCQKEAGDPMEYARTTPLVTNPDGSVFSMEPDPYPSYFIPNLKWSNYDPLGATPHPLIPISRQQMVGSYKTGPNASHPLFGPQLEGPFENSANAEYSITTFFGTNIFDRGNAFPPYSADFINPPEDELSTTPFASIIANLRRNDDFTCYKYGGFTTRTPTV